LHGGLVVCDLIYTPEETQLLREAKAIGAVTLNGVEMLVQQGAVAFEIWTGVCPPVDVMREALLAGLRGGG
nr:shikimate dehydrogenase [Armatimonadota bacterium]